MNAMAEPANSDPGATDLLSVTRFQHEIRQVAQSRGLLPIENPLTAALKIVELNPAFSQSRMITRLLTALTSGVGEFRMAEISAFDSKTLAIVLSMFDAFAAGKPGRDEWLRATDTANRAQIAAG